MSSASASQHLRVGTRGSELALTQTRAVCRAIRKHHPSCSLDEVVISTQGDLSSDQPAAPAAGPAGLFTSAIERALLDGRLDLAVHSHKDLPTEETDGLLIGAVPPREMPHDVLVTRDPVSLDDLPAGFRVGTGSPRRAAQIRHANSNAEVVPIRGNVPTRLSKLRSSDPATRVDGVIVAAAGLHRLGLTPAPLIELPPDRFPPAPGQGALAVQCRADDAATARIIRCIHDEATARAVRAERLLLRHLGTGCTTPLGAHAQVFNSRLVLIAQLFTDDGRTGAMTKHSGRDPEALAREAAAALRANLNAPNADRATTNQPEG